MEQRGPDTASGPSQHSGRSQGNRGRGRPRQPPGGRRPRGQAGPGPSSVTEPASQPSASSPAGSGINAPLSAPGSHPQPETHGHPPTPNPPRHPRRPPRSDQRSEQTQSEAQPNPPRQSRRARFKASLTETESNTTSGIPSGSAPGAHLPQPGETPPAQSSSGTQQEGPSEKRHTKPSRFRKPPGDDLTSTLTHSLRTPPYPDCSICFNSIRPEQPTWSCSPPIDVRADDDKAGSHCCWNTFHLKCIRSWAEKSVKDLEEAWRARGESRPGEWRCPGCRATRKEVPHIYMCFCRRMRNPMPPRIATPHSCSQPCSRPRTGCAHACPLPCHPGPCPPCAITIQAKCFCGKEVHSAKCQDGVAAFSFSCGTLCNKALSCGHPQHRCTVKCHGGPCAPCQETEEVRCWCGRKTKRVPCGTVKIEAGVDCVAVKDDASEVQAWIGIYGCDQPCQRPFACSEHLCSKPCHPPSRTPAPCPFDPERVTSCACGRCRVARSQEELANSSKRWSSEPPVLPPRVSCTSPLPTCTSPCSKTLPCGHVCKETCHWDACPPCTEQVERPCRCGSTKHKIPCGQTSLSQPQPGESPANGTLCDKPCLSLRSCGRHQCGRVCCPLASLSALQRAKGKKRLDHLSTDALFEDLGAEERGLHECDLPCNRVMGCGNHRCTRNDHKGTCGVCLRSVFEELMCPCGRTTLEPPIACGTTLACTYPCARPLPACGHPHVPHACHEGVVIAGADTADEGLGLVEGVEERGCPPCPFLTRKLCACGKKMVSNVRCSQERVSCGSVCGKSLACGFHRCERLCHADGCGTCTAVCGKARKSCLPAHHPCTQPCHAPAACPETEPCLAPVTLTCPCGNLRSTIPCSGTKLSLACTGDCEVKKRNARLAEALGISEEKRDGKGKVVWSSELVGYAKGMGNAKFVGLVEKAFSDFVTCDKRTQVLPHMPPERRKFVNDLATVYRMDTMLVDQEPHRSVQLIRRIDTRVPTPLLSQHVASLGPSLGRLVDLRSSAPLRTAAGPAWGVGASSSASAGVVGTGAGSGSGSGSGGRWGATTKPTGVVTPKNLSGNVTPVRVPSPAVVGFGGTGVGDSVQSSHALAVPGPSRSPVPVKGSGNETSESSGVALAGGGGGGGGGVKRGVGEGPRVWVSPSVQARRVGEGAEGLGGRVEDVPDDWEDDV